MHVQCYLLSVSCFFLAVVNAARAMRTGDVFPMVAAGFAFFVAGFSCMAGIAIKDNERRRAMEKSIAEARKGENA